VADLVVRLRGRIGPRRRRGRPDQYLGDGRARKRAWAGGWRRQESRYGAGRSPSRIGERRRASRKKLRSV
jgi:hypothetical protein